MAGKCLGFWGFQLAGLGAGQGAGQGAGDGGQDCDQVALHENEYKLIF